MTKFLQGVTTTRAFVGGPRLPRTNQILQTAVILNSVTRVRAG